MQGDWQRLEVEEGITPQFDDDDDCNNTEEQVVSLVAHSGCYLEIDSGGGVYALSQRQGEYGARPPTYAQSFKIVKLIQPLSQKDDEGGVNPFYARIESISGDDQDNIVCLCLMADGCSVGVIPVKGNETKKSCIWCIESCDNNNVLAPLRQGFILPLVNSTQNGCNDMSHMQWFGKRHFLFFSFFFFLCVHVL